MAGYGQFKYQSPEVRALATITRDSYDKDQAKNLQKLNGDVSYLASFMRKMQSGIDSANENVLQQMQGFVNDIIVLLGGGNAKGFDFGDLRYVLQMIGALLGFNVEGGIAGLLPLNAFNAVWHMLSGFIFPTGAFKDIINAIIDGAIGQILDWFGDIPIVGGAVEQFAEWISEFRDNFFILSGKFSAFITNITDGLGDGIDYLGHILTKIFNTFIQPIIDLISRAVGGPIGKAIDWIQTSISKIFNLASGADSKASLLIKKAVPLWESLDGNGETSLALSTADALLVVNATNSRGAFVSCRGGDLKQTISMIASKTGTVTTFNLDVYSLNSANGADLIYSSPDLSSALVSGSGNETVIFHEMTDDHAFNTNQNSYYYVMMRMTGSGSISVQGRVFPVANTAVRPLYPGLIRNPTGSVNPSSILSTTLDGYYVKETPYVQLGTLDDITPQSFYFDFSSLTTNLWYFKTFFTGGLGNVKKLAVTGDGKLYFPGGGANGFSAITHKYNVGTNRCRVGMFLAEVPSSRATTMYMFSRLDMSSYVALRILDNPDLPGNDYGFLSIGTAINTLTDVGPNIPLAFSYWNKWVWLEYEPDTATYYVLVDPDFESATYRNFYYDTIPGACVATYSEFAYPALAAVEKSSTARSGGVIMLQSSGGVNSAMVDDMKLEDYMLMA